MFYEVIVRKGVPLLIHSDAAKEFLSKAMGGLASVLGIARTDTMAHNPKSNAKIERVWTFVGNALKSMTPEQYAHFHLYMPILAHVWNNIPDSDTGITPYEAEHGMKCRSIFDFVLENPPTEGLPATAEDLKTVAVSARAFMELLTNIKAVEKSEAANRLNANGTSKIEYNVGDHVSFYHPPSDETARKMNKRHKHILQYSGPGEIIESLSPTGSSFKIKFKGRTYRRNVMHMNPYRAITEVRPDLQLVHDNTVSVGSYVAVLDNETDQYYHLGQVVDIDDVSTQIHYMGTKSRRLRDALWTKLYHHPGTNEVVFHQPAVLVRNWTRYLGTIDTKDIAESLIILPNIGFTDHMRVTANSRNMLSRLTQQHHIMGPTWNP